LNRNNFLTVRWAFAPIVAMVVTISACTGLRPGFETPTVTVNSFRALPSEGALPNFEIGLHVINPNPQALALRGVSYTVSLEGHELMKGVANDLPVIDAYGEGKFKLTAAANLFAGIGLITDLMRNSRETFNYSLEAKLDVGAFIPAIRIRDAGEVSLRPAPSGGS
jgi:LEA14-like dessication related protein